MNKPIAWYDPQVMDRDEGLSFTPGKFHTEPLYKAREWVELTRGEFLEAVAGLEDLEDCWYVIEAKLREKNT